MPAVALDNVHYAYGSHRALDGVTMRVERGALHALLGPNGSGKTTLFRLLMTLLHPQGGTVRIDGVDVAAQPGAVRQKLGAVFQHAALDDELTVEENLRVQAALYGMGRQAAGLRSDELLDALDLGALRRRRVRTLSGGERRRADLARALVHRPALLLLDEPTTALDPTARRQFHTLLAHMRRQQPLTILMATHLLDEAENADGVTVLHRGRVVADGPPDALRGALGREVLWITPAAGSVLDADPPPPLPGGTVSRVGARLRVEHPRPVEALGLLGAEHPGSIASATVRQPTLEDVFFAATGAGFTEAER